MIDWQMVVTNGLWILGLSLVLAAFSYNDWLARETTRRRSDLWRERAWHLPRSLGMCLTCAGWAFSQRFRQWDMVVWLVLAAWFLWDLIRVLVVRDRSAADSTVSGTRDSLPLG